MGRTVRSNPAVAAVTLFGPLFSAGRSQLTVNTAKEESTMESTAEIRNMHFSLSAVIFI
jgi:hypothetical protein